MADPGVFLDPRCPQTVFDTLARELGILFDRLPKHLSHHALAQRSRDVMFANSSRSVSDGAPRVPRYFDKTSAGSLDFIVDLLNDRVVSMPLKVPTSDRSSFPNNTPSDPHHGSTLVGFEAGFGNRWPH